MNHRNRVQASIVDRRSELWLSLGVMVSIKRISSGPGPSTKIELTVESSSKVKSVSFPL